MSVKPLTPFARICIAAIALCIALSYLPGLIGEIAGAVLVPVALMLPGYLLTLALFGRSMERVERLAASIGLSLCLLVLGGLVLNVLPFGLTQTSWLLFIVAVSGCLGLVVTALGKWERVTFHLPAGDRGTFVRASIVLVSAVLIVTALVFDILGAQGEPATDFTQLWLVPSHGNSAVTVGILNEEHAATAYRLRLYVGHRTLRAWKSIRLPRARRWTSTISLPAAVIRAHVAVNASLFRLGVHGPPYRTVRIYPRG